METLFEFLTFSVVVMLIIGLISPASGLPWDKKASRAKVWALWFTTLVLILALKFYFVNKD